MFCPICGRAMSGAERRAVAFPMHICAVDGIVYDARRGAWYGFPEVDTRLCCPACGSVMETEPKEPPIRMFFCYQCGTTYDRQRGSWYGLSYHLP